MNDLFKEKSVLVTGGTGSFGSAMVRELLQSEAREIKVFSRDESKQFYQAAAIQDPRISYLIGDIRDFESIKVAMRGVDYVFHAAALKHVPAGEEFPEEFLKTNVLGSKNVYEAALGENVLSVVSLSTDKAVDPSSAMGLTKALMEKLSLTYAKRSEGRTKFVVTRFGNVLLSRGSVVPKFIRQLKSGQPITLTDEGMTRYFMSLDDALGLVSHALLKGSNGSLFVRRSHSFRIIDLARSTALVLGVLNPQIQVVGKRVGEKLFEGLMTLDEVQNSKISEVFAEVDVLRLQGSVATPRQLTDDENELLCSSFRLISDLDEIAGHLRHGMDLSSPIHPENH